MLELLDLPVPLVPAPVTSVKVVAVIVDRELQTIIQVKTPSQQAFPSQKR